MIYYARSQNDAGERETAAHHLQRVAGLCQKFCAPLKDEAAGEWMGLFHDLGKYSPLFQQVLAGRAHHVDHALPGAALLYRRLCGPGSENRRFLPLALAVRAHHGSLSANSDELRAWLAGKTDGTSPEGRCYSIPSARDAGCRAAFEVFMRENPMPSHLPAPPVEPPRTPDEFVGWMLFVRLLFSALTDADYTAAAEHFDPDFLARSAAPPLKASAARRALEEYRTALRQTGAGGDPAMAALREELFEACRQAGAEAKPGAYTLTAPTGAGKTLALLAFGLEQLAQGRRRIIFVLPYLSILEQNAAVYRAVVPGLLEDHSQLRPDDEQAARLLAQRWDAGCIITTSVRFFEGLFGCDGPNCRRLHQVAGSVILFDEAQSLPANLANATLRALRELCGRWGCTVVFSTATQPAFDALAGSFWHPQEIVPNPQALFDRARRITCRWQLTPQPLEEIARSAAGERNACVILNLRRHARQVYEALLRLRPAEEVFLLSTELCPAHRAALLAEIRARLQNGLPCCLAATQCIEAGVDLSFDNMFRALAPLEGIVQAAGRCNRHDTRRRGQLTVFVPQQEEGEGRLYPDDFYRQGANAVRALLARHPIDLDDLAHIREYFDILYGQGGIKDKPALTSAIQNLDFAEVRRQYRLIEEGGVPVVVPYAGEAALYAQLCAEADEKGVTGSWLRRAAPLTITCYDTKLAAACCEPLRTPARAGQPPAFAGCWLLRDAARYDSARTGLQLSAEHDMIH